MDIVSVVFVLAFVFLSTYFLITVKRGNLPPGPIYVPFIGSVGIMLTIQKKRPHVAFHEMSSRYGNVMSLRIGSQLVVLLTGYDAVYEALVMQADTFSDRPTHLTVVRELLQDGKGVIFNNYGRSWKVLRKFTLQALRDFGVGQTSLEEKVYTEIETVTECLEESRGHPVDINTYMQKIVGNVIYRIVFGFRYGYDDPEFDNVRDLINTAFEGAGPVSITNFLPSFIASIINRLDAKNNKTYFENAERLRKFVYDIIGEHESTYNENNIRDFVDLYIWTTRDETTDKRDRKVFTKSNMFRLILDLFLAGSETTSTTLAWAFLHMSEYPDVQAKCQLQIEEVVGSRLIQYSDRGQLTYVEATLMEIQRMSTVVPLSVAHCTTRDTFLAGYSIPKQTMVLPNLYSVSTDPKYWKNPKTFNPDRFLDKNGRLIKHDAFLPFSTGPRTCLGEPLARLELFLVFSSLLQRFTFHRENDELQNSLESQLNHITNAPLPHKLRAVRR